MLPRGTSCTSPSLDKLAYTVTPPGSDAGPAGRLADLALDALRPRFDVFEARAAQSEVRMAHLTGLIRQQAYSPDNAMGVIEIDEPTAIYFALASFALSSFRAVGYHF